MRSANGFQPMLRSNGVSAPIALSVRQAVAPAYLLLCLLLGGSVQGVWTNLVLQLLGIAILAWAALVREPQLRKASVQLFILALAAVALVALQMVPLPPPVWTALGGREFVARGFAALGVRLPWLPLSLTPYETAATLLFLIPPLAMFAALVRLGTDTRWLVGALLAGTLAGILLGVLQVSSPGTAGLSWYLYRFSSFGLATGFFSNANHMAALLLVTLPFLAATLASAPRHRHAQRYSAAAIVVAGLALMIVVGLAINKSLAGYLLAPPVILASILIVLPFGRPRRGLAVAVGLLFAIAMIGLWTGALAGVAGKLGLASSVASRQDIYAITTRAAADFMPFGSGLGSFTAVYGVYENHQQVTNVYVNHAHNDYLELALELGLPGIALIALFLLWWVRRFVEAWTAGSATPFTKAAAIASGAILLHSLVDYPLRTSAIGACFAMCLGLLSRQPSAASRSASDLRPTRHVVVA